MGLAIAMCGLLGCLPSPDDFMFADVSRDAGGRDAVPLADTGSDGGPRDAGIDRFVPQECGEAADCRTPRDDCQLVQGECTAGECVYTPRTGDCDDGDRCTRDDACTPTGCMGSAVTCTPPGPRCESEERVTSSGGRCEPEAGCVFDEAREACEFGCAAGECSEEVCLAMDWALSEVTADVGFASDMAHALDASGGDHVAYVASSDPAVHYILREGAALGWTDYTVEAGAPGMAPKDTAIGLDAAGRPHIVFARWNDEVMHAEPDGVGFTVSSVGAGGSTPSVAITPAGDVHVVYARTGGIQHAVRGAGETEWTTTGLRRTDDGFTRNATGDNTILLIDATGTLHLVFNDFGETTLTYARRETTEWEFETIYPNRVIPSAFDAALDSAGGVHVSFTDDAAHDLRYAYRPSGVGSWSRVVVHTEVNALGDPSAVTVTPAGAVHIAYRDDYGRDLRYASRPVGGAFTHEFIEMDNSFPFGAFADDEGRVRLLYRAVPSGGGDDVFRIARMRICP